MPDSDRPLSPTSPTAKTGRPAVFISHRHKEDQAIAKLIGHHLTSLSRGKLDVFLSQQMRKGSEFRTWIRNSVDQADVLIFICATPESLTPWCIYELSRFLKKSETASASKDPELPATTNVMCLLGKEMEEPPPPIDDLQGIRSAVDEINDFYIDLLISGKYIATVVAKPDGDFYRDAAKFAQELSAAMSPVHTTEHFRGRLTLTFRSEGTEHTDPLVSVEDDQANALLQMMGCRRDAKTLSELKASIPDSPAVVWMEELLDSVGTHRHLPALTPFQDSNGVMYMPVPSRMDKIDNKPAAVEILFVVIHDALRDCAELEARDLLARQQYEIIKLLRMGRRFRYDIVEPWKQALHAVKFMPARDRNSKIKVACEMYLARLRRLQREGEAGRYNTYSAHSTVVGLPRPDYFEQLWADYFETDIGAYVDVIAEGGEPDLPAIEQALEQYLELNKKFMLVALEGYMRKIEEMEPAELRREAVIPEAFMIKKRSPARSGKATDGKSTAAR